MILGIVGCDARKFTALGQKRVRWSIANLITTVAPTAITSGHCSGVDIWAEELAQKTNYYDERYIFEPKSQDWEGYRKRNIQIAEAADFLVCYSVDRLPSGKLRHCYHCRGVFVTPEHAVTGGCWTRKWAHNLGKPTRLMIISNF
jgi:hypothetical protein